MKKILIKTLLFSSISAVSLLALDIPTYYNLEIKSLELSLEGSKERLACLQANCSKEDQYVIDDKVQTKIQNLYMSQGTTPSKHIGFYIKHEKEVKAYYDNNTTLQEKYQILINEVESVNTQLKSIMEAQQ